MGETRWSGIRAATRFIAMRARIRAKTRMAPPATESRTVPHHGRIDRPGTYILGRTLRTDRAAVLVVTTDDVTIDLNGHAIFCTGMQEYSVGVDAHGTKGLTLRNGAIGGCTVGVRGDDTIAMTIDSVDFTGVRHMGINRGGQNLVVRHSRFADIGGYDTEPYAVGINGPGQSSVIEFNEFRRLYRQAGAPADMAGEGVGIVVSAGDLDCTIRRNWFENEEVPDPVSIAIFVAKDGDARIENNVMINFAYPIGSESPVVVSDNLMVMRYRAARASPFHLVPGSSVMRNTMIGFSTPVTDGMELCDNLQINGVPAALKGR